MNNYNVALVKVLNLVNPFRDNLFFPKIYLKEIERVLANPDALQYEPQEKQLLVNKIVHKINYYYPEAIVLNLNHPDNILESGLISLAAATYRHESQVVCHIIGDEKVAQSLLGVNLQKPDNVMLPVEDTSFNFDWSFEVLNEKNAWDDSNYVIAYMSQALNDPNFQHNHNYKREKLYEVIKYANDSLWNNPEVLKTAHSLDKKLVDNLPFKIAIKESLLEYAKKDLEVFCELWNHIYRHFFDEQNVKIARTEEFEPHFQKQIYSNINKIKNEFFNDKNFALKTLKNVGVLKLFLDYFSSEIKFDTQILEAINDLADSKKFSCPYKPTQIFKSLPQERQKDHLWCSYALNTLTNLVDLSTINSQYYEGSVNSLFKGWIDDKEKVLYILEHNTRSNFYNVFKKLPQNLQNDSQVIDSFMKSNILTFKFLSLEQKPAYLKQFLLGYQKKTIPEHELSHNTRYEDIVELNDKEVFLHLAKNDYTNWFLLPNIDKKLFEDKELIKIMLYKNQAAYKLPNIKNILLSLDDIELNDLIANNKMAYEALPREKRNSQALTLTYIEKHGYSPKVNDNLFWDKNFCVEVLKINTKLISKVPNVYWKQKDFILKICQALDEKTIDDNVLKLAPEYIKPFFDTFNVSHNYKSFMENYFLNLQLKNQVGVHKEQKSKKMKI